MKMRALTLAAVLPAMICGGAALADDIACVSTTFRFIGANDKVCVSAFDDPKVPGVACHISQARTGGLKGTFGLAEDQKSETRVPTSEPSQVIGAPSSG